MQSALTGMAMQHLMGGGNQSAGGGLGGILSAVLGGKAKQQRQAVAQQQQAHQNGMGIVGKMASALHSLGQSRPPSDLQQCYPWNKLEQIVPSSAPRNAAVTVYSLLRAKSDLEPAHPQCAGSTLGQARKSRLYPVTQHRLQKS